MNIIKQAKAIRNQSAANDRKAQIEYEERETKRKIEKQNQHEKVWKALEHINDSKDFKLTRSEHGVWGGIARLEKYVSFGKGHKRELHYLGTVCIKNDLYMWRGSDESPEQEVSSNSLTFQRIVNDGSPRMIDVGFKNDVSEAIPQFSRHLASILSEEME